MTHESYHGSNGLVNGAITPLHPGEIRTGGLRLYPTMQHGNSTVRVHVTNEVDMFIARSQARLALIRVIVWGSMTFSLVVTMIGLLVSYR